MRAATYGNAATLAQLTGASDGETTQLRQALEAAARQIDGYCGRAFHCETAVRYFDGDGSPVLDVDDLLSVTSIAVDDDADHTWGATLATTDYVLWPYNRYPKMQIHVNRLCGDYSVWSRQQQYVKITALWGYGDGDRATPYTAAGSTVTVATTSGTSGTASVGSVFAAGQTLLAGTEQMYVLSVSGNTLTVIRGVNGTTAAVQSAATAYLYDYPADVIQACYRRASQLYAAQAASYQGGEGTDVIPAIEDDGVLVQLLRQYRRLV